MIKRWSFCWTNQRIFCAYLLSKQSKQWTRFIRIELKCIESSSFLFLYPAQDETQIKMLLHMFCCYYIHNSMNKSTCGYLPVSFTCSQDEKNERKKRKTVSKSFFNLFFSYPKHVLHKITIFSNINVTLCYEKEWKHISSTNLTLYIIICAACRHIVCPYKPLKDLMSPEIPPGILCSFFSTCNLNCHFSNFEDNLCETRRSVLENVIDHIITPIYR